MLPALIVGGLTAWYLGLRAGVITAIVIAVALLVVTFVPVPGLSLAVHILVIAWAAAVYFLGGKITRRAAGPGILGNLAGMAGQASAWAKKLVKRS